MTWGKGREEILALLNSSPPELERVGQNLAHAERLLGEAENHVRGCGLLLDVDPPGAAQLAYDATRKACEALLAAQGLRSTRQGGHIAVADAARAQFNGPKGMLIFAKVNQLRRERAGTQYPREDTPTVTTADASAALETARAVVEAARKLLDSGKLTPFDL